MVEAERGVSTSVLSKPKIDPTPLSGKALSEPVTTISGAGASAAASAGASAGAGSAAHAGEVMAVQAQSIAAKAADRRQEAPEDWNFDTPTRLLNVFIGLVTPMVSWSGVRSGVCLRADFGPFSLLSRWSQRLAGKPVRSNIQPKDLTACYQMQ
jgi:hypothetical protein